MKVIKLNYNDPDIFGTKFVDARKYDLISKNFESFMHMYKSQGSIFWLRFLVSFKSFIEENFSSSKKWSIIINFIQFRKILNYLYINIHKKFIEGSNTCVKKYINNLLTLTLNSPHHLKISTEEWIAHFKASKHLQNVFQSICGIPSPAQYSEFIIFIFTVQAEFFSAVIKIFQQWTNANDLPEEEIKNIDFSIIYWLPTFDTDNPLCFEKYISDFWGENLDKMLLTENLHVEFGAHNKLGCCDEFDKERNLINMLQFTPQHASELAELVSDDSKEGTCTHKSFTSISLRNICVLKPQVECCDKHNDCCKRICHDVKCLDPYICNGVSPCILTCETSLRSKQEKNVEIENFWKNISVEIYPVSRRKKDASTFAESYTKDIETYLHARELLDLDFPFSMIQHTYSQYMTEMHNFDNNIRKKECLNRLRRKLSEKHPEMTHLFKRDLLKEPNFRMALYEKANNKLLRLGEQYCFTKNHSSECHSFGLCFLHKMCSVAVNSTNAFGRVVHISKTSFTIAGKKDKRNVTHDPYCNLHQPKHDAKSIKHIVEKSSKLYENPSCNKIGEKVHKSNSDNNKVDEKHVKKSDPGNNKLDGKQGKSNFGKNKDALKSSFEVMIDEKYVDNSNSDGSTIDEKNSNRSDKTEDDEVEEILRLIGIEEKNQMQTDCKNERSSVTEDETVDMFLKLISASNSTTSSSAEASTSKSNCEDKNDKKIKLRLCAFCQRKETERKTFKRCSRCKEENFPVHRYYCSRECLIEDWTESHQQEHLKNRNSCN